MLPLVASITLAEPALAVSSQLGVPLKPKKEGETRHINERERNAKHVSLILDIDRHLWTGCYIVIPKNSN